MGPIRSEMLGAPGRIDDSIRFVYVMEWLPPSLRLKSSRWRFVTGFFFPPVFYAPEALQFIPKEYYLSQIFFAIMKKMEKSSSF